MNRNRSKSEVIDEVQAEYERETGEELPRHVLENYEVLAPSRAALESITSQDEQEKNSPRWGAVGAAAAGAAIWVFLGFGFEAGVMAILVSLSMAVWVLAE